MADFNDKELITMFREAGKKNYAFNLIVKKYQQRIYWQIRKMVISHDDSDDVVQNTFIKAYQGLSNFREDAGLFTWLYRIATNEALTFLKQKKRRSIISTGDYRQMMESTLETDAFCNGEEIELKLQKAILTLPDKQRLVFNMKYFDEMKYEEMSDILDTSVGALKASFHHAMKKIEAYLAGG